MTRLTALLLVAALACSGTASDVRRPVAIRPYVVIDIMELYTRDSPADIEQRIRTAVANLNADMVASGIGDVQFNLVYVGALDHYDMAAPEIHDLRDRYRADLVGVWTPLMNDSGGMSLVPDPMHPLPYTGFHALPTNQPVDTHILSHEVGHNLGLLHEHGICRTAAPAFRDIMTLCKSVDLASGLPPLIRAYTSPARNHLGVPFGPPDASEIIRQIAPHVAQYR